MYKDPWADCGVPGMLDVAWWELGTLDMAWKMTVDGRAVQDIDR